MLLLEVPVQRLVIRFAVHADRLDESLELFDLLPQQFPFMIILHAGVIFTPAKKKSTAKGCGWGGVFDAPVQRTSRTRALSQAVECRGVEDSAPATPVTPLGDPF